LLPFRADAQDFLLPIGQSSACRGTGEIMLNRTLIYRAAFLASTVLSAVSAWPQEMSGNDRGRALDMLQVVANDVRKHYYDPKFHGVDWDATVAEAKQKIEQEKSFNMALSHIAATLDTLNDSHTFLLPPQHAFRHDFGWQYQMIGERCFVTRVRPHSDAETKGLKAGDEVLSINGTAPARDNLWKLKYTFSVLRPQPGLRLEVRAPNGDKRELEIAAKIREKKRVTDLTGENGASDIWDLIREDENLEHLMRVRFKEFGSDVIVMKVPEFAFSPAEVNDMIGKVRSHKSLILDLRGDPGGAVETLKFLLGGVFQDDVKVANRIGRKESKPEIAKASHNPFLGGLIVLVDSQSASASELFARVVQIEKRGVVLGDHTSGSVMESRHYEEKMGADTVIFYGVSVTEEDLVMTDGKSLEHTGVTPDQVLLPSGDALAHGRDPVLARALELVGVKLSSEDAGKLFPYEWPPE
jgi:carboxyl-terminal processing protease